MFKKTMTALGATLLIATPALAIDGPFPIREVETTTYFGAMENPNALDYYPELAIDVAEAVKSLAIPTTAEGPHQVDVDIQITSMRLNDDPVLTGNGDFNILEGTVTVEDATGGILKSEPVVLRAEEMDVPYANESPDNRDFYNAMVMAFADRAFEVANSVTELPTER